MEYISVTDFAQKFGISRQMVWKMIHSKKLNVIQVGKLYKIPVSEVDRIEKENEL